MSPRLLLTVCLTGCALAVLVSVPAEARQLPGEARPERPYQGLFGRETGSGTWAQELTASLSLSGGWDSDVLAGARGDSGRPTSDPKPGRFGSGSAGLTYAFRRTAFDLNVSAGSSARFYGQNLSEPLVSSHSGTAAATVRFSERTTLSAQQTAAYQPFDSRQLFAPDDVFGLPGTPDFDTSAGAASYLALNSRVDLSRRLSRRTSLQLGYGHRAAEYRSIDERQHSGLARLSYDVAEGLSLRLGYGYQVRNREDAASSSDVTQPRLERHTIDAGVNFNRALSISRRTTLSFGTGMAAVEDLDRTRFRATGNVQLLREVGRSWNTSVGYSRNVQFIDYLDRPVTSDGLQMQLGGLVSRRLSFQTTAGASRNAVGFDGGRDNRALAYHASAAATVALSRHMNVGLTYSFYQHDYGSAVALPEDVPFQLRRHVAQINFSIWAPLLRRAGRPDAAR